MITNYAFARWQDTKEFLQEKLFGGRGSVDLYPIKDGTHIVAAAWLDTKDDIYTGDSHLEAVENAARRGNKIAKIALKTFTVDQLYVYDYLKDEGWRDGFLTSDNIWVTREEGMKIARHARQVEKTKRGKLDSFDMI